MKSINGRQISSFLNSSKKKQTTRIGVLLVFVAVVFFSFGFHHLQEFVSFDEHYWMYSEDSDRIHQYWEAIKDRDWEDTRVNDKPGITLAYTAGFGMLFHDNPEELISFKDGTVKIFNPEKTLEWNWLYRLPVLLISGLFIFYFFWIIKKLTDNPWLSMLAVAFLYLSPIMIGMSQIVNPDSMFWIFGFSTMLTFAVYMKENKKKYVWLTILFFGLSMASKYVSIIFIPFFLLMMLSYYLFNYDQWQGRTDDWRKRIISNSLAYLVIIVGGVAIFSVLMPAVIVKPKWLYEGTIGFPGMAPVFWAAMVVNAWLLFDMLFNQGRVFLYLFQKLQVIKSIAPRVISAILLATVVFILINWLTRHRLLDLSEISFDMKRKGEFGALPFLHRFIMEPVALIFSLTPIALLSLIYLWVKTLFQKIKYDYLSFILTLFILIFYAAIIGQGLLVTIRYSIILYPITALLSALAIWEFFDAQKEKKDSKIVLWVLATILSMVLFIFTLSAIEQAKIISEREIRNFYNFHGFIFLGIILIIIAAVAQIIHFLLTYEKLRHINQIAIFLLVAIPSIWSIWLIKPYYFSYSNEFLPKKYIITSGWGYGGYEAATYLNQQPNAKELTVWADSYGFCEFFVGKCIHKIKVRTDSYPIDYMYSTLQSQLRPEFIGPKYRESKDPIWKLEIDGRYKNYVKLYKAEKIEDPSGVPNQ